MSTCQEIRGFVWSSPKRKSQQIIVSISGAILRGSWTQAILVKNASPPPAAFVQLEVCSSSSSQASYRRHPLPLLTGGDLGRHPEGHLAHRWLFDSQAMKTGDAFIRCSPLQAKVAVFTYKLPVSLSQRIFSLYHWSQQRRFCC